MTTDEPTTFAEAKEVWNKLISTSSMTPEKEKWLRTAISKIEAKSPYFFWRVYVRKDKVFVPNVVSAHLGICWDREPYRVVDLGDRAGIERAVQEAMDAGNMVIPYIHPDDNTGRKALQAVAHLRSWKAFQQYSAYFGIGLQDYDDSNYTIHVTGRKGVDGSSPWGAFDTLQRLPRNASISEIVDVILKHVKERTDLN